MSRRWEFVLRRRDERTPFVELCAEFGISPKTGYKWLQRYAAAGPAGLFDRSRRPLRSPEALSEDVVCRIIRLKDLHPTWGPRKVREVYARACPAGPPPSESSFKRVLDKAGKVERRRQRPATAGGRLQHRAPATAPNEIWTMDFKGWWYTPTRQRCEPFTVRDAYSRYVLAVTWLPDAKTGTVRGACERLFVAYGLPGTIRSDNGAPFATNAAPLGLSRLSAWWLALGIDLDRIDPGCPYQNGGHERMHLDLARDLERRIDGDWAAHQAALETWRRTFNDERPHEALGMRCPSEFYKPSARPYEGTPERLEYAAGLLERTVDGIGCIKLQGRRIRVTQALCGWNVGLQPQPTPGQYALYFAALCLGRIDLATESFQPTAPEETK